jgi:membrane protein implicated in regulation of membrane protease activity
MDRSAAGLLIVAGLVIIAIGILAWTGALTWFGRLPGDIRIERPGTRIYIPIVSMLIVSVVLSVLLYVGRRLF